MGMEPTAGIAWRQRDSRANRCGAMNRTLLARVYVGTSAFGKAFDEGFALTRIDNGKLEDDNGS